MNNCGKFIQWNVPQQCKRNGLWTNLEIIMQNERRQTKKPVCAYYIHKASPVAHAYILDLHESLGNAN